MRTFVLIFLLLTCHSLGLAQKPAKELPTGVVVVPLMLAEDTVATAGWVPGDEVWLEVQFLSGPKGEAYFVEPAEKVWWLGEMAMVMLGASGQELPHQFLSRGVSWVRLDDGNGNLTPQPMTVYPRKQRLRFTADAAQVRAKLGGVLPGVDSAYLSQVANFLAGNLANLDILGTSYSVSGVGEVINAAGEWTGPALPANQNLFDTVNADTGGTTADTLADTLTINGSGIVSTAIAGDVLTIDATEADGDASNELQNLFQTVAGDTGSTTANTQTDTLTVAGSGIVSTSISGDTLTIDAAESQNLFQTVNGDTGSTSADTTTDTLTIAGGTGIATTIAADTVTVAVSDDSLDFSQLSDSLTVDAATAIDLDSNDADLNVDTNTFFLDASLNRVGMGTATPSEQLHVHGGTMLQTPPNPVLVGSVAIGSDSQNLHVSGQYAYVTDDGSDDLKVIDVSVPSAPTVVGNVTLGGIPHGIYVAGRYAYVTNRASNDLTVIDLSDASAPSVMGSIVLGTEPQHVSVSGRYAYVTDSVSNDLRVVDISDPNAPSQVAILSLSPGDPFGLTVEGHFVYVVDFGSDDLTIIDVSDPFNPTTVGNLALGGFPRDIAVSGRYAYVLDSNARDLKVIDVSDPSVPSITGSLLLGAFPSNLFVSGRYVYVTDQVSDDLRIIDVANPLSPVQIGAIPMGRAPRDVFVVGRHAYIIDSNADDLRVLDISGVEATSVLAHSLEAGQLQVRNNITAQGHLSVTGGVNVGAGGLFSDGNMGLAGSLSLTNSEVPTSSPANAVQLYAQNSAASSELRVRDEAGNVTTLSPHNFSLIGAPSEPLAWSYYSEKDGTKINVDMLKAIRELEALSGKKLVHIHGPDGVTTTASSEEGSGLLEALEHLQRENQALKSELARIKAWLGLE